MFLESKHGVPQSPLHRLRLRWPHPHPEYKLVNDGRGIFSALVRRAADPSTTEGLNCRLQGKALIQNGFRDKWEIGTGKRRSVPVFQR
jgi:hypothetical protein